LVDMPLPEVLPSPHPMKRHSSTIAKSNASLLRPLRHSRMSSAVALQIKELIFQGRYKPGDRLPSERDLAQHLRVGRPTVREAIQQLAGLGLLDVRPAKGVFVRSFTPDSVTTRLKRIVEKHIGILVQVVDARIVLEGWVAAEAARRATPEEIARIGELVRALENPNPGASAFHVHLAFHQAVLEASHNIVVFHFVDTLTSLIASVSKEEAVHVGGAPHFHRAIAEAIAARDPERAQQAMVDHLKVVRQIFLDAALSSRNGWTE
jgi:GntR family transcriptional repressor for pyruvate dehydrogenase complex